MIENEKLSHWLTRLSLKQQGQLRMKMDAINKQRQITLMLLTDYRDELTPDIFQLLNVHLKAMDIRELKCSTDEALKDIRNNDNLTAKDRIRLTKDIRDEHQVKMKALQVNQSISTDAAFDSLLMDNILHRENSENNSETTVRIEPINREDNESIEDKIQREYNDNTDQEQQKTLWSDGVHIPGIHPPRPKLKPRVYIDGESFVTAHNLSMIQAPPGIGKSSICESILSNVLNKDCEGLGLYVDEEVERAVFFDCERDLSLIDESNEVMLKRANIKEHNTKAIIVGLRESFSIAEKKQRIIQVVEHIQPQLIMIDGVADLVLDTNGIEHTNNAYLWLMEIIVKYDLSIIVTLHPNKGTTTARGHIGSEMLRRCEGVIEVSENIEGIRTMQVTKARRSKKTKASFKWDEDVQMMVSCDVKQGNTKKPSIIQSLSDYEIEQLKQALGFEIKHEPGKIVDKEIRVPILYKLAPIMDALKKYLKEEHPQVNTGTNNVGIFLKDLCFENKHILKNGKSPGTTYVFQNIDESDLIVKSEIIE
jgi:hypothetical protein